MGILSLISSVLGLIPGLEDFAAKIAGYAFDAKVKMVQARTGADQAVATEIVKKSAIDSHESTERLKVISGNWVLLALLVGFATPYIIFEWKVVVIDIVINGGTTSTDPIKGQVADWANVIIPSLFGGASALTLGSMWFNRRNP